MTTIKKINAKATQKVSIYKSPVSECWIIDNWLENTNDIYKKALELPLDDHPKYMIYGKECAMNRSIGFFSSQSIGYKYSNQIATAKEIPNWLNQLMTKVNNDLNTKFNGVLVNHYKNGNETIGAHSDDEKGLSDGKVACISLGASRKFRIKNKLTQEKIDALTKHGQLLVMEGNFQKECTHEIPKEAKINGSRISLTFRCHIE